jgi:hypothetical protein
VLLVGQPKCAVLSLIWLDRSDWDLSPKFRAK